MTGSTEPCTSAFAVFMAVSAKKPTAMFAMAYDQKSGATDDTSSATPKSRLEMSSTRKRARSRRADMSAPESEPIARIELSRPKASASRWNSSVDIVARKTGKLKPKVPSRNTATRTAMMSGRCDT